MAYQGAEAIDLGYTQARLAYPLREAQPSFEVIEGGGLDARARRGVSAAFMTRVWVVVAIVFAVLAVGVIRINLSTATVSQLEEVKTLRSQVSDLEDLNARLEVERSVDASSQRIVAIATQAYGMVYASDVDTLQLSYADETEETGGEVAENAADASDADRADDAPSDDAGDDSSLDGMPIVATVEAPGEDGR